MIIGGIAVIARGVPRQTIDIDATVAAADLDLEQLLSTLAAHRITPRIENVDEPERLGEFDALVRRTLEHD